MAQTVLLTLGRLPKGLEVARSLATAGCRVLVADPHGQHLCVPSNAVHKSFRTPAPSRSAEAYLDRLVDIVETERVDLIVPVSEEILFVSQLKGRLPPRAAVFSDRFETLLNLHHKGHFCELARTHGLPVPHSVVASDPDAVSVADVGDFVIKPVLGCSGDGLSYHRRGDPIPEKNRKSDFLVQQKIDGTLVSAMAVARDGATLGTSIYKGTLFSGTVATSFERIVGMEKLSTLIKNFIHRLDFTGFISFDVIVDQDDRAWFIECNPRLTSAVHFFDPEELAAAILETPPLAKIGFKPQSRFQEGHTTLMEAYGKLFQPREFRRRLGLLRHSRDVLWSSRDPLPFLLMTPMSWRILGDALFNGLSIGKAVTKDITWVNGQHSLPQQTRTSVNHELSHGT